VGQQEGWLGRGSAQGHRAQMSAHCSYTRKLVILMRDDVLQRTVVQWELQRRGERRATINEFMCGLRTLRRLRMYVYVL